MKKIILTSIAVSIFLLNYAQENVSVQHTAPELFAKAKKEKTAAWICVGTGSALFITGIVIGTRKVEDDLVSIFTLQQDQHDHNTENVLLITGGAIGLASIPLFIASSRNNLRARLMIANQKTAFGVPKGVGKNITGLTLTISLR